MSIVYIPSTAVEQYQKLHDLLEKTEEKLAEISKTTDTQVTMQDFLSVTYFLYAAEKVQI